MSVFSQKSEWLKLLNCKYLFNYSPNWQYKGKHFIAQSIRTHLPDVFHGKRDTIPNIIL